MAGGGSVRSSSNASPGATEAGASGAPPCAAASARLRRSSLVKVRARLAAFCCCCCWCGGAATCVSIGAGAGAGRVALTAGCSSPSCSFPPVLVSCGVRPGLGPLACFGLWVETRVGLIFPGIFGGYCKVKGTCAYLPMYAYVYRACAHAWFAYR